ncbi:histidine phosphatase family protein [Pelagibius sp. Alg239-R121]|uniref:SixA phosphatase family protein n=1 Tax=Pelagibius sp. Alg239-R121 TaxID=2993448 RepID=UPI0024A6A1CA|nr:histidine phosphatase family protein [Pelagibius sp. Alg239-R121]
MKKLYLLRHAKSDWKTPARGDFERPLAARGHMAAPRMGREMVRLGIAPALVLCSTARRAAQTYDLMTECMPPAHKVEHREDLYMAPPAKLKSIVQQQSDEFETMMLIGHNPGMEALAGQLAGNDSDAEALSALDEKFPTAAIAAFELPVEHWKDLAEDRGKLVQFVRPRDLRD